MMSDTAVVPATSHADAQRQQNHRRAVSNTRDDKSPYEEIPFFPKVSQQPAPSIAPAQNVVPRVSQEDSNIYLTQIERLKTAVREKENTIFKLKHENMLLKQIERRQQKELENMEVENEDAPRVIKGLRDEITGLRTKLKDSFANVIASDRKCRAQDDVIRKLKEQAAHYEELVKSQELGTREALTKELTEARTKLAELERVIQENQKRAELQEKNYYSESKSLRAKIHALETENGYLKGKVEKAEATFKEKEREIASLSIYRYNALHKKPEAVCKVCQRREKEEAEMKRKQKLKDQLPVLATPNLQLAGPTTVIVTYNQPTRTETQDYSALRLLYSSSSSLDNVVEVKLPVPPLPSSRKPLTHSGTNVTAAFKNADELSNSEKKHFVDNLETGKTYYFWLVCGIEDIESKPSSVQSILVDVVPEEPPKPFVSSTITPPVIRIFLNPPRPNGGTPIRSYKLSGMVSDGPDENGQVFAIADLPVETPYYDFKEIEFTKEYKFRIQVNNLAGYSQLSEWSESCVLDTVPNRPSKPTVHKLTNSSVKLITNLENHGGSEISYFTLVCCKVRAVARPKPPSVQETNAQLGHETPKTPDPYPQPSPGRKNRKTKREDQSNPSAAIVNANAPVTQEKNTVHVPEVKVDEPANEPEQPFVPERKKFVIPRQDMQIVEENNLMKCEYVVPDLEPGVTYVFSIKASNKRGTGETSEWSDEVDLDHLLPLAITPSVTITSPTSVRLNFGDISQYGYGPNITGHIVYAVKSTSYPGSPNVSLSQSVQWRVMRDFVQVAEQEVEICGLDFGETYWIRVALVGQNEQGEPSNAAFVPLAAALPLPRSPSDVSPLGSRNNSTGSIGSRNSSRNNMYRLSRDERLQNMHEGNPSHHLDPKKSGSLSQLNHANDGDNSQKRTDKPPVAPRLGRMAGSSLPKDSLRKTTGSKEEDLNSSGSRGSPLSQSGKDERSIRNRTPVGRATHAPSNLRK